MISDTFRMMIIGMEDGFGFGANDPIGGIFGTAGAAGNFGAAGAAIFGAAGTTGAGILNAGSVPAPAGASSATARSSEAMSPAIPPEIIRVYSLGPLGSGGRLVDESLLGTVNT